LVVAALPPIKIIKVAATSSGSEAGACGWSSLARFAASGGVRLLRSKAATLEIGGAVASSSSRSLGGVAGSERVEMSWFDMVMKSIAGYRLLAGGPHDFHTLREPVVRFPEQWRHVVSGEAPRFW